MILASEIPYISYFEAIPLNDRPFFIWGIFQAWWKMKFLSQADRHVGPCPTWHPRQYIAANNIFDSVKFNNKTSIILKCRFIQKVLKKYLNLQGVWVQTRLKYNLFMHISDENYGYFDPYIVRLHCSICCENITSYIFL